MSGNSMSCRFFVDLPFFCLYSLLYSVNLLYFCALLFFMNKTKQIISFLLAVLFISYYASISLFSHLHIISGATIVHSHFHTDSHHDTKSGGHTEQSITLIAQISHFDYIDSSCNYIVNTPQYLQHENTIIEISHWIVSVYLQNLSLRAPPIV